MITTKAVMDSLQDCAASVCAEHAPWGWTPSFGGTLLVCLNVNV